MKSCHENQIVMLHPVTELFVLQQGLKVCFGWVGLKVIEILIWFYIHYDLPIFWYLCAFNMCWVVIKKCSWKMIQKIEVYKARWSPNSKEKKWNHDFLATLNTPVSKARDVQSKKKKTGEEKAVNSTPYCFWLERLSIF